MRFENILLVSNWAYVFRILCNTDVRYLDINNPKYSVEKSSISETNQPSNQLANILLNLSSRFKGQPIRACFYPNHPGERFSDFLFDKVNVANLQNAGWTIVQHDDVELLLTH